MGAALKCTPDADPATQPINFYISGRDQQSNIDGASDWVASLRAHVSLVLLQRTTYYC